MRPNFSRGLLVVILASVFQLATPMPLDATSMLGSKHNLYLVTCTPSCFLGVLCSRQAHTYTAVLFYANGAVDTLPNTSPTHMTTISSNPPNWEGASYSASLGRYGTFHSYIDANAASVAKGQIAGSARLDAEDFVCFKDGATSFKFSEDLGLSTYTCTAQYWCPSIQV